MNILMMTNTYLPHVGGVARSVDSFTSAYRDHGHQVMVVAPEFPEAEASDGDEVLRIPAIQNFNGSDFSVVLPVPGKLERAVDSFRPDIIHSHHPFLIGATALRLSSWLSAPLVFTHHTMYEQYTHYVPGDSGALKRFVIQLSTSYANLCDQVLAPSQSIADILRQRKVRSPIDVIPTGIVTERFAAGDGDTFRRAHGIPPSVPVIGHVGRLAPEKNLAYLAEAVARVLTARPDVHFLVVGSGPSEQDIEAACRSAGVVDRLHLVGRLSMPDLAHAYCAMDLFAFASVSETQGMVLAEAMAAGLPVVAIDAPGVREVVVHEHNGYLLSAPSVRGFAEALDRALTLPSAEWNRWREAVTATARRYSRDRCAGKALAVYRRLDTAAAVDQDGHDTWHNSMRRVRAEWNLLKGVAQAAGAAARFSDEERRIANDDNR